jgi:hypothetical protein
MSEQKQKKTIGKGGVIELGACGAVIIVLLVVVIVLLVKKDTQTATSATESEPKRNVVVTPDNVEETISQLEESDRVSASSYEVSMTNSWHFADGSSASDNAYVANPVGNTSDVYFDITLADSGETIYSSPVLPIGSHLENITLDKALESGTYDCIMTYTLVDSEQNPQGNVNVSMTITIDD